jgi:hypothetical protein
MEELLFSRRENKLGSAFRALEITILELRHNPPGYLERVVTDRWKPVRLVLFDFPARLFPVSLAGQRLLDPFLFSRLQVKGVSFDLLDDVLLLDLTLEAAKGVF